MIIEKTILNLTDFNESLWHDNKIHAISFNEHKNELLFDIDHIVKWVNKDKSYHFWVCPCTLAFQNARNFELEMDNIGALTITDVYREQAANPEKIIPLPQLIEYEWDLVCTGGEIWCRATGFEQYLRKQPVLLKRQSLDLDTRGGISFAKQFLTI